MADITGAYVAGLVISCTPKSSYIQSKFEPLSFLLLTPVFFASVGIKAKVDGMTGSLVLFSILLLLISVATRSSAAAWAQSSVISLARRACRWAWAWSAAARWR